MFKKVLLATDGSEPSKHALNYAIEVAKKFSSELLVISVLPPVIIPADPTGISIIDYITLKAERAQHNRSR